MSEHNSYNSGAPAEANTTFQPGNPHPTIDDVKAALSAAGIALDTTLLKILIKYLKQLLGKTEPKRIDCTVTGGPNDTSFHQEFRFTYDAYGYPEFRLGFNLSYLGTAQYSYAHINRLTYRSGKQRSHFNVGGLIRFTMPGARRAKCYRFTGHYSTKSGRGRFRIYTDPVDLEKFRKPGDHVKANNPDKNSRKTAGKSGGSGKSKGKSDKSGKNQA